MPTSRPLTRLFAALALGCGAALLASCAAAAPAPAEQEPDTGSGPSPEPAAGGSPAGGGEYTVADVVARYPSCAAVGALVSAQIEGMEIIDDVVDSESVDCLWKSPTNADVIATFGVTVDANMGADDVPTKEIIELSGLEYVPDAGLEAAGGIANLGRAVGDLRSLTTVTNVPGVYVTFTQTLLGVDPDFGGTPAVAAAKQLLGIDG
ncbi:hypothetical protein [Microbacterium sp. SORGH_AS_0862]|uniref:hypothetical protein n=1 Tax=Microbacterium sp. SORGH_AS_0862 TaxID=3041789 RepID=UPI00279406EF|nr:hypothetical protein [Microbacterium sp. SORGH_AS_0862]MDQ1205452.1 hypothetical protein [Microbacterium sp. SORGH_AS_0862]